MSKVGRAFQALTIKASGGLLRELRSTCHVSAAFDPASTPIAVRPPLQSFTAIWDTGASATFITQKVVDTCGLKPFTMSKVSGAYGGPSDRNVYLINIGLPNGVLVHSVSAIIGEMESTDVLIGMNIITLGDFALTNEGGLTTFSFRIPSCKTIDYVQEANQQRKTTTGSQGGMNVIPPSQRRRGKHR